MKNGAKIICISLALCLISSIMTFACTRQSPTPTPAPTPTPTPAPTPPQMEPQTWLFNAGINVPDEVHGVTIQWFGDEVEKRTNGLIKFDYAWMLSLGPPGTEMEGVRDGVSEMCSVITVFYPTDLFLYNMFQGIPFPPKDFLLNQDIGSKLLDEFPALHQEVGQFNNEVLFFNIGEDIGLCSAMPITKFEDLKGKKVAVSGYYWPKQYEAAGATPVSITMFDRVMALQTGMIDASALSLSLHGALKMHEVGPYMTRVWSLGLLYNTIWTINKDLLDSLPQDIQEIIVETAREAISYQTQMMIDEDTKAERLMREAGVVFNEFSNEDLMKWASAMGNMPERMIRDGEAAGKPEAREIAVRYMDLYKEAGLKFPLNWGTLPVPD